MQRHRFPKTLWLALPLGTLAACSGPGVDAGPGEVFAGELVRIPVSEVNWDQLNPARGDQSPMAGTLWGDRSGTVATGYLLAPVDGFRSPPHIHNVSYRGVVIRGLLHNDEDAAEDLWMPAGSFWTQPKGAPHITAALGADALAYIEIDEGPYLVQPVEEAFDSGEYPVNVHASNLVWVDEGAAQVAYLWGEPEHGRLGGALLRLPADFVGTLYADGTELRAVVVAGSLEHRMPNGDRLVLDPGSYLGSTGAARHRVASAGGRPSTLYVRTTCAIDRLASRHE